MDNLKEFRRQANILKAIQNPMSLRILELLITEPRTMSELSEILDVKYFKVDYYCKKLKTSGIIISLFQREIKDRVLDVAQHHKVHLRLILENSARMARREPNKVIAKYAQKTVAWFEK